MRKNHWISLAIALVVASLTALMEQRRGHYFLDNRAAPAANPQEALLRQKALSLDQNLAFLMQRAEWATYDVRFKVQGGRKPHPDIVIVAVDEKSLKELHQWPWPRSLHAALVKKLSIAPPKALAFDILFMEPFNLDPAGDRALIEATRRHPWVVHSYFFDGNGQLKLPFPALLNVCHRAGYVNAFIDEEGVLRSAFPRTTVEGQELFLLSVEATGLYLGQDPATLLQKVPIDRRGRILLNYVGKDYTFPYISYTDVLHDRVSPEVFANKVVLVGASATGTFDHYPTPTSNFMPGIEFHANVVDNLIHLNALRHSGLSWTYLMIGLFGLLCGLVLARFSPLGGAAWALFVALSYCALAQWLFTKRLLVLDIAGPLMTLGGGYVAVVIYRFFTEEREKRMVKSFFSQQVSGELLEVLMNDPTVLKKAGERREMTAFFSDVAGFTSISERLEPEELVELLNRYLTAMTDVIFEYDGYLDKYMGDGIMAFWNGLLKQPDHAERACRCALKSSHQLARLNQELEKRGLVPLSARIGVNTGIMAAGYMGSSQKKQYTIMGDNVNLASRLEGANKAFGTSIMISEFTYDLVQDRFEVRFLDKIRVPGKAKPVKTYELLAEKGELSPPWQKSLPIYHEAIQFFADRQFDSARAKFLEVLQILGHDKPCETYIERAQVFAAHFPPKEWDGVFELKTK